MNTIHSGPSEAKQTLSSGAEPHGYFLEIQERLGDRRLKLHATMPVH